MKSTLILSVLMALSANTFAQTLTATQGPSGNAAKVQICNNYFETKQDGRSTEAQVEQIVVVYNAAFELNYDATQLAKLKAKFLSNLQLNPKKINELHNGAFGVCMTEFTSDDFAEARAQFAPIVGEPAPQQPVAP